MPITQVVEYTEHVYGKCLVSGQHVYITTTYPRFLVVSADMEATIHVPEDFEEAENCFIGKQEVLKFSVIFGTFLVAV